MSVGELPHFTMRQLLEAGVHFGHQTHRWNPKMAPFIYGARNNIHIIDLRETLPMLHRALVHIRDTVSGGGRLLFVGTKRQASNMVADAAQRCGQYYVNHRWLGGMLTNWKTISNSIKRLRELEERLETENAGLTKKELLRLTRERDKLDRALGGIKDMGGLPDILFIIDTVKEDIAVKEATKLGIPVVAVIDSNADPAEVTHPIPGNDDAARAIDLYLDLAARAVIAGLQQEQQSAGVDIGEAAELEGEVLPESAEAGAAIPEAEAPSDALVTAEESIPAEEAVAAEDPVPAEEGVASGSADDDKAETAEEVAEPVTDAEPAQDSVAAGAEGDETKAELGVSSEPGDAEAAEVAPAEPKQPADDPAASSAAS